LRSKEVVEELELELWFPCRTEEIITGLSMINNETRTPPCPNMKVLRLQFQSDATVERENISQWCIQMMKNRRFLGYPIEKCCILWGEEWEKATPLVLVMQNGAVGMEE
jgi:hypothetical protein